MSRRTIFKVLLLLAAGATLNVAVAWGLARWGDTNFDGVVEPIEAISSASLPAADVLIYRNPGVAEIRANPFLGTQEQLTHYLADNDEYLSGRSVIPSWSEILRDPTRYRIIHAKGWPCLALWCEYIDDNRIRGEYSIAGGVDLRWERVPMTGSLIGGLIEPPVMPLRPLWPGFAVNTLFYAGVLWMLFCGPFALRRMIRRRRGLCATCAYPIGQSPVCTECGAAVSPRRGAGV